MFSFNVSLFPIFWLFFCKKNCFCAERKPIKTPHFWRPKGYFFLMSWLHRNWLFFYLTFSDVLPEKITYMYGVVCSRGRRAGLQRLNLFNSYLSLVCSLQKLIKTPWPWPWKHYSFCWLRVVSGSLVVPIARSILWFWSWRYREENSWPRPLSRQNHKIERAIGTVGVPFRSIMIQGNAPAADIPYTLRHANVMWNNSPSSSKKGWTPNERKAGMKLPMN